MAAALASPGLAIADPCEGPLPRRAGEVFSGEVRYIVDGDGFCIGPDTNPKTWIEVRLADFNAPELARPGGQEAKSALDRLASGRSASCTVQRGRSRRTISYDRVIAACSVDGKAIGDAMRAAGVAEGGN